MSRRNSLDFKSSNVREQQEFYFKHVMGDIYMAQSQRNMLHDTLPEHIQESKSEHFPSRTKIICTIGPPTQSTKALRALVDAGMNVARLNFSHGDHAYHKQTIANIKHVRESTRRIVAILLDTKGPEIRTLMLAGDDVHLKRGQFVTITTDPDHLGTPEKFGIGYPNFGKVINVDNQVLIDDGLISLKVTAIEVLASGFTEVKCLIENDGVLGSRKGVNLPNVIVDLPAVTEKDKQDILFGVAQGVDFIAASFVRSGDAVQEIRDLLDSTGPAGKHIKIISKIENQEGLDNFPDILALSDGIMVARGDLGVEIPIEHVALAQKMMIQQCNMAGKFVITATQMLESMTTNPSPTRAEASDVANAVLDGTDCVMLSGETAKGKYPTESVTMMADICRETEKHIDYHQIFDVIWDHQPHDQTKSVSEAVAASAVKASFDLHAKAVLVLTDSGRTAKLVSKYRPRAVIIGITSTEHTARQLMCNFGVFPVIVGSMLGSATLLKHVTKACVGLDLLAPNDTVVATAGLLEGLVGATNRMQVMKV